MNKRKNQCQYFFEKDTDAEILVQWKTSFEIKIKEHQDNIVKETEEIKCDSSAARLEEKD